MINIIDKLHQKHTLTAEEYRALLLCEDAETLGYRRKRHNRRPSTALEMQCSSVDLSR